MECSHSQLRISCVRKAATPCNRSAIANLKKKLINLLSLPLPPFSFTCVIFGRLCLWTVCRSYAKEGVYKTLALEFMKSSIENLKEKQRKLESFARISYTIKKCLDAQKKHSINYTIHIKPGIPKGPSSMQTSKRPHKELNGRKNSKHLPPKNPE